MIGGRALWIAFSAALALQPAAAHAQLETFVAGVRELAEANGRAEPSRLMGIRAAADRMGMALVAWDRNISALESRVRREIATAPAERVYQLHVELGVTYRARGRTADALREFDAAIALRPSSDVHVLRALTLEAAGHHDEAGAAYQAAWRLDANSPVKAYYLAERGPDSQTERDRARAVLRDAYRDLRLDAERPASAPFVTLSVVPDTVSRAPVVGDEATAHVFALLRDEKYSDAVAALGRAAHDGSARPEDSPLAHFARGQRDEAGNRIADARREYVAALAGALAGRSVLLVAIGRLAQVEGDSAAALDAFGQAARVSPNDPNVHKELAAAYAANGGADAAFAELMAALLIDPRDAQAHASIGQLYLDTGHDAEAISAFGRALELKPDGFEVRYALATAHSRLGHAAEAARQLEIYDRLRRQALDERRRNIANETAQEERRRQK
jgi:tetratricopeptide (TPR) repeat protein